MGEVGDLHPPFPPPSLIWFVFDPKTISTRTKMNWDAVPLRRIAVLAGIGFLFSFFPPWLRCPDIPGVKPAPDFNGWTGLFNDSVKLSVEWLFRVLPLFIVLAAGALFVYMTFVSSL
jgi:hypothetical protein